MRFISSASRGFLSRHGRQLVLTNQISRLVRVSGNAKLNRTQTAMPAGLHNTYYKIAADLTKRQVCGFGNVLAGLPYWQTASLSYRESFRNNLDQGRA